MKNFLTYFCVFSSFFIASGFPEDPLFEPSACMSSYQKREKQLVTHSLLNPILSTVGGGVATITLAGAGSYVGEWVTSGSTWGSIVGSQWGYLLGLYGSGGFLVGREAVLIYKWIDTHRMLKLLDEVYSNEPGKITLKIQERLHKKGIEKSVDEIQNEIKAWDQTGALCDGTLSGHPDHKRLRKRLVSFRKLVKHLGYSSDEEDSSLEDESSEDETS